MVDVIWQQIKKTFEELSLAARKRDFVAGVCAFLLHLALFSMLLWGHIGPPRRVTRPIETRAISRGDFAKNRTVRHLTPDQQRKREALKSEMRKQREEAEQKKLEEQTKLKGQIVDLPASPDNKAPENAKYLSEFNTRTEKERKSRFRAMDYKRATNELTGLKQSTQSVPGQVADAAPPMPPGAQNQAKEKREKKQAVHETPKVDARERLALSIDKSLGLFRNQAKSEERSGNSHHLREEAGEEAQEKAESAEGRGSGPSRPAVKNFMPSLGQMSRIAGAPPPDYLSEDIPDGDGTFLNSREFKFAPFFNRLKQSISQHWKPMDEFKRRDPTGNIYGFQPRYTVLSITLNGNGDLKNVQVVHSSGVEFLDREAIAAIERAQPFPNPPKQLVKDGVIEFPFGFHIEFNPNGGMGFGF